jgi:hypothetical protein
MFTLTNHKAYSGVKFNVVVYDLGLKNEEVSQLAAMFPKLTIETFDFDKYPEHVSLKRYNGHNCSYAWKPIIIHEVCETYKGIVHWFDTRNLYNSLTRLILAIGKYGLYTPVAYHSINHLTHPATLRYMNGYQYRNLPCRSSGVFGVNYDVEWCKKIVREWKELALVKECIVPEGSNRSNHRQDQSVLSILYYKYLHKYKFKRIDHNIKLSIHKALK